MSELDELIRELEASADAAARRRAGRRRRPPSWSSAAPSWRRGWAPSSTAPGARPTRDGPGEGQEQLL